ncbi:MULTISPECIES: hypothetical protein [unclassified Streptosporangium]|uniref:hypothetical protein n=1 Tax=unclassified Streptosporangium TaxID=2632669 RepID=UPI002E28D89A|nr:MULTISPECIES: hypothetical protein [unclassified Streptosporangium]
MIESIPPTASLRFLPVPWPDSGVGTWANDLEERLVALAGEHGFQPSHATKSKLELVHPGRHRVVYLDRKRLRRQTIAVIVPPWVRLDDIRTVSGVTLPEKFFHSSNMRTFPKSVNTGENEIPYGYSLECVGLTVFGHLLDRI